jgi:hypothetical protein
VANWQRTLNLTPQWEMATEEGITTSHLARVISERLAELEAFDLDNEDDINELRDDLVDDFKKFSEGGTDDQEEFNFLMAELYDWGDLQVGESTSFFNQKKVCWVKTI